MTMLDALATRDAEQDRASALLDERDTLTAEFGAAMADQSEPRMVIGDAEVEMSSIEAEHTLAAGDGSAAAPSPGAIVSAIADTDLTVSAGRADARASEGATRAA